MKTITLKQALDILEQAEAIIIVDCETVVFGSLDPDSEEFYEATWDDGGFHDYRLVLNAADNQSPKIDGNSLVFKEQDGLECRLKPLFSKQDLSPPATLPHERQL